MVNKPKQQTLRDRIEKSVSTDALDSDLESYLFDALNSFAKMEPMEPFGLLTAASAKEALTQLNVNEEKLREVSKKTKAVKHLLIQQKPAELLSINEFLQSDADNKSTKKH